MATILDQIVAERRIAVREARGKRSLAKLEERASERGAPPPLAGAFPSVAEAKREGRAQRPRIIAEIKKASPSKGLLRADFRPREIAEGYQAHGARAISVLTEEAHFQGSLDHLAEVARAVSLPLLRKDFLVDPYQVAEARAFGASAILIILACTEPSLAAELRSAAREYGLDVLAEVHGRAELDRVLEWEDGALLGINNRDLHTFKVSLKTTLELLPHVPGDRRVIAESGIATRDDLAQLAEAGAGGFLIGEAFMRSDDPGGKLAELIAEEPRP